MTGDRLLPPTKDVEDLILKYLSVRTLFLGCSEFETCWVSEFTETRILENIK